MYRNVRSTRSTRRGAPVAIASAGGSLLPAFLPPAMRANPPDIYVNLKTNQAWKKAGNQTTSALSLINVSRTSAATQVNSLGVWSQVSSNTLARTDLGASIWEARTNSIRNNTMQGASAPNTMPTFWDSLFASYTALGVTMTVVQVGVDSGIDYIRIRLTTNGVSATAGSVTSRIDVAPLTYNQGETWTGSFFSRTISGSWSGFNAASTGCRLQFPTGSPAIATMTSLGSTWSRLVVNGTSGSTGTANGVSWVTNFNAVPLEVTFDIGWPQLENNSLINSSVASATKAADGAAGVNGSAVYSVGGGTGTAATLNVTWAAGVMTVNSVASAGGYTTFPPSPATLTYVSGAATGWTGATVNLTPTDNSAKAVASNPILTTNAAATRNAEADLLILTGLPTFGASYSIWGKVTPFGPTNNPLNNVIVGADDGTFNNAFRIWKPSGAGAGWQLRVGGVASGNSPGIWTVGVSGKLMAAVANADQAASFNGSAVATAATTPIVGSTFNQIGVGQQPSAGQYLNGNLEEFAIWFTQRVPDAQLQSMTT